MELVRTKIRTCTSTNVRIVGRDSSVFIATSYGLDGPGIESRRGGGGGWDWRNFPQSFKRKLWPNHDVCRVFPGGKAAGAWR